MTPRREKALRIFCAHGAYCELHRNRAFGVMVDSAAGPVHGAPLGRGGNLTEGGHPAVCCRFLRRRLRRPCRRDNRRCSVLAHRGSDLLRTPNPRWHCSRANLPAVEWRSLILRRAPTRRRALSAPRGRGRGERQQTPSRRSLFGRASFWRRSLREAGSLDDQVPGSMSSTTIPTSASCERRTPISGARLGRPTAVVITVA